MIGDGERLRRAEPSEAAAIRALVREAYAKWVPVIGREPRPMQADYEAALREHRFDVVDGEAGLIGLIETKVQPDHLWIENVAVLPVAQGRGIGRQLLAHAEGLARQAGLGETRLLTNKAFDANVALYSRLGYVIDREEPYMGGITLYMSKRLG